MRTLRTSASFLAAALLVLAGCRIEKPATAVPPPPDITRFTASASTVAAGTEVTLSWAVSNATALELRDANGEQVAINATAFDSSVKVTVTAEALYVLTARSTGGSDSRAVAVHLEGGASGVSFQALPPVVPGGQTVTLVWNAPGVDAVTISDATNMVDLGGQGAVGAVIVTPLRDTTYTLTAGEQTFTAAVTVQPAVLTLTAPAGVSMGGTVRLAWTSAGAEKITVSSPGRGVLSEVTDAAQVVSGSFDDVIPSLPAGGVVTYEVTAVKGTETMTRTAQVIVGSGVQISRFEASLTAAPSVPYLVRWETVGAAAVELLVDDVAVFRTSTTTGQYSFVTGTADFAIELVATSASGDSVRRRLNIDVVGQTASPTLTAAPTTVAVGSPVTLTFSATNARRVRIESSEGEVVFSASGIAAEAGTTTVKPTISTTYTASFDNLLGDAPVTATAAVTVTGTPTALVTQYPPTAISGQSVRISPTQSDATLIGFPHRQLLTSSQANFLDISSTGTRVVAPGEDVNAVTVPFAALVWGARQGGSLTVSRAGWMSFGAAATVLTSEVALPSTSAPPALFAPYWDDLRLTAASGVFYQVVGEAPDQELVVQWNKMQAGTNVGTELTFEVRVHQHGTVSFEYQTMVLPTARSFTIGVQDPTRTLAVTSTTAPANNSALQFFAPLAEGFDLRVVKGSRFGGYIERNGELTFITAAASAWNVPGDIALSEIMFNPSATVPQGQYLEVYNGTALALDMTGWSLSTNSTTFTITPGFALPPGVGTVLGETTDRAQNDDAGVALAWGSALSLGRDGGSLKIGTEDAGVTFTYGSDAGAGVATEISPGLMLASSGSGILTCPATRTFGGQVPSQRGSPGTTVGCFGYAMQTIPSKYVDVSDGGTALITNTSVIDGITVPVTIAANTTDPAPVAFGVRRPSLSMSSDGWIVWTNTTTTSFSNKSLPSTSTPVGTLSPFWDDSETVPGRTPANNMYWKHFTAGEDAATPAEHWVFQWAHFKHYGTTGAGDDLNFEVKLFVDGTIEYHYAAMVSGTSSNWANGNGATVWLEEPTGTFALAVSINQPTVLPNSAVRFVPLQ